MCKKFIYIFSTLNLLVCLVDFPKTTMLYFKLEEFLGIFYLKVNIIQQLN